MPNYLILDINNVVINSIYFENDPTDITPFLDAQKLIFNDLNLTCVKVTTAVHEKAAIGYELANQLFRPIKPFPSYIWDESKEIWRAPKLHPELIYGVTNKEYEWDEENLEWKLIP